ncbi:MAG TPA: kelch repeat-containing protein [Candidatus Bathyarchaeia archaeon]|nr:kelch repeat-containing protein [Candidatus Bathyarchaeia archaeon]
MFVKNKLIITSLIIANLLLMVYVDLRHINFVSAITKTPSARYGHDMVYDSKNNQTILFGGDNSWSDLGNLKSTWIYSSISQTWVEIANSISPSVRINHKMVFNSNSGKIILFGGMETVDYTRLDDTWEFDSGTNEWIELHPTISPSARSSHAMYFDSLYNVIVLFGGYLDNDLHSSETWIYNCTSSNWYQINPISHPATIYGHSFDYDEEQQIGVFFGGRYIGLIDETWFFNLTSVTWTKQTPMLKPLRRYWFDMVYNPFEKNFILFGGDNEESSIRALDDTWIFTLSTITWTKIEPTISPFARNNHAMIFDIFLNKTLLFGGYGEDYSKIYGDLWMYDSKDMSWYQISSTKSNTWKIILLSVVVPAVILGIISTIIVIYKKEKRKKKVK